MERGKSILLIGATGLVGSRLAVLLRDKKLLTPFRSELDIVQKTQVYEYFRKHRPKVVIHCADFTDVSVAEQQRGNKKEICWQVGVNGTRHVVEAAANVGAFVIFLSTGSVFVGTKSNPGPFKETDFPSTEARTGWHAWTKVQAEKLVSPAGAIIRISHPVKPAVVGARLDYLHKMLELYKQGRLYPLFTDQRFPITEIDDLFRVVDMLISTRKSGIFHVASRNLVMPYEFVSYALRKLSDKPQRLISITFAEFIRHCPLPRRRYSQYSALDVSGTEKQLGITFPTWQEIVGRVT